MSLPAWLKNLRRSEITRVIQADPRTNGQYLLGVHESRIFREIIGGGQADFDTPAAGLSADDQVLLYAYFNQLGHLEELSHAFGMLLSVKGDKKLAELFNDLVAIDLGCGPFTGGLALAAVLGRDIPFTYVGMDRSSAMRKLGEKLAVAAVQLGELHDGERYWVEALAPLPWTNPPGWRPVLVIVSYLFASTTLDVSRLVAELEFLLQRIGRGPVAILYTNSTKPAANSGFPLFRSVLEAVGFELQRSEIGQVRSERWGKSSTRDLQYALFWRQPQNVLKL